MEPGEVGHTALSARSGGTGRRATLVPTEVRVHRQVLPPSTKEERSWLPRQRRRKRKRRSSGVVLTSARHPSRALFTNAARVAGRFPLVSGQCAQAQGEQA